MPHVDYLSGNRYGVDGRQLKFWRDREATERPSESGSSRRIMQFELARLLAGVSLRFDTAKMVEVIGADLNGHRFQLNDTGAATSRMHAAPARIPRT